MVRHRAGDRCEYCGLSQIGQAATFHIDHIIPQVAGGQTVAANLALACVHCSLRKGAKQQSLDPQSSSVVPLFNPRLDMWNHHFRWTQSAMIGITATGRATIRALALNSPEHQIIRTFEAQLRRHPPPGHQ
ncbi:MAG: HNH endonuclease [Verrucomicrobiales bacterium]|nr:HNH endonuclease [Verrucomicrobiales bacterium]